MENAQVLRCFARRAASLAAEAREHERPIVEVIRSWRPDISTNCGVGPILEATVLSAWSRPQQRCIRDDCRHRADSCIVKDDSRHRLNRSGDRRLNQAGHTVMVTRMRVDPETKIYVERRRAEGKTDRDINRCLKRYVTRQLFRLGESFAT